MNEVVALAIAKYEKLTWTEFSWIGDIPDHWKVERLGKLLDPISVKNREDLPLLSITREKGVILRDLDDEEENHNFIPDDLSNYKMIDVGQFGMNKMKAWQGSYGISKLRGIVSPAYFIFSLDSTINPEFFHYAIRSQLYVSFFAAASDGVRIGQWDLSKPRMKAIPFVIPTVEEQTRIVEFLDSKTAQVDKAIAQKEKQIELLKERQQILIHKAVTRGLNPSVKMKDSGVDWIGEVPEHWDVIANRALFLERIDPGNDKLPILSVSIHTAVSAGQLDDEDNIRGKIRIEDKSKYKFVDVGDIVFNMMRAWQGAIGSVSIPGMVSPAYIVAKPKRRFNSQYFEYLYRTEKFIQRMDCVSKGITDFRKRLYWDEFKQLITLLPPVNEQNEIVSFISQMESSVNRAINSAENAIDKLKEYKATLINSVVTGKIRV
jgi:type I restriction enzyme, S subunit